MWDLIVTTLYLFLPAYVANMTPVFVTRLNFLPRLAGPLDGGRTVSGQQLFGPHKTIRGFLLGIGGGVITAVIQKIALFQGGWWEEITLYPYEERSAIMWGLTLGSGALFGDLVKSFLKRRLGIPPGARWFPWDQLDMILGALLFGAFLFDFSLPVVVAALILTPFVGLVVNLGGYALKLKEAW